MKPATLLMTPRLTELLGDFCEPETLEIRIETLEAILDYILAEKTDDAPTTLAWAVFIRNLNKELAEMCQAVSGCTIEE